MKETKKSGWTGSFKEKHINCISKEFSHHLKVKYTKTYSRRVHSTKIAEWFSGSVQQHGSTPMDISY